VFAQGFAPRRVVVTGMGIVSPLGLGVAHVWKRLVNGESGLSAIQSFDLKDLPAKVAGQVPKGAKAEGKLDLNEWIPIKDQKKMDRFIQLAVVAAAEAVENGAGVLFIVKNFAGDVMSFEMAAEMLNCPSATVLVHDDVSLPEHQGMGRRGVAGTTIVEKIVGAAAEAGWGLAACQQLGQRVVAATASIGGP